MASTSGRYGTVLVAFIIPVFICLLPQVINVSSTQSVVLPFSGHFVKLDIVGAFSSVVAAHSISRRLFD